MNAGGLRATYESLKGRSPMERMVESAVNFKGKKIYGMGPGPWFPSWGILQPIRQPVTVEGGVLVLLEAH